MIIFSIAEIGVNHFGSYEKALLMIHKAKLCGADAVKFQKYNPIKLLGKDSPYLKDAHQLSWEELTNLSKETHKLGMLFGCSVFDVNDVPIVDRISDYHKIATRMAKRPDFIAAIDKCKKLTFMSIDPTLSIRIPDRFKLLWCVAEYPTCKNQILSYPYTGFGLSSHCPDWTATFEACKKGARIIENHVCMSREDLGCDIPSSLTFEEYAKLLEALRAYCKQ